VLLRVAWARNESPAGPSALIFTATEAGSELVLLD